jgi:hypothetical protein
VRRSAALIASAVTCAVWVGAAACDDDAPAAVTTAATCGDCRQLGVGRNPQLGAATVGVRQCGDGSCALSIQAADGTVSRVTVRPGDTIQADGRWVVVSVDGSGLVVRPA